MILIVFLESNRPFRLPLTRISWHKDPYSKKPPPFQATVAFLAISDPFFTYRGININIQSTRVDQNFVRCFSCPKGASVQISSHLDIQIQKNSISKVVVPRSPFSNKYVHFLFFALQKQAKKQRFYHFHHTPDIFANVTSQKLHSTAAFHMLL